ncbi:MAG TPA: 4Fe-4S dicluster domain-containing protein, partial [Myxococcota bacterium]|nr:4Fe-4S dicluster domain-containing protein [Myxococcota bacterium]
LHVVLVDNGRTRLLADPRHRSALACIRCGACLNSCPVYRRAGGHAYGWALPGPIGSVLAPALAAPGEAGRLPFASTLCGSCSAVCPVKIDLHDQLVAWRGLGAPRTSGERLLARLGALALAGPLRLRLAGRLARALWPLLGRRFAGNPLSGWLAARELPHHPGASFRARFAARPRSGAP